MIYKEQKENNKVDIAVLMLNNLDINKLFIKKIYENTKNFSLIIVDNGSTDGTSDYLKSISEQHNNISLYISSVNTGVIGGRNICYEMFKKNDSDYLVVIDNDQIAQAGWLDQHLNVLENFDNAIVGAEAWQMRRDFYPYKHISSPSLFYHYVGCGGSLIRRKVLDEVGFYDDRFNPCYFEDPDLCFRISEAGYGIGWNYKARLSHLGHQTLGKMPSTNINFASSYEKFVNKWKGHVPKKYIQEELL